MLAARPAASARTAVLGLDVVALSALVVVVVHVVGVELDGMESWNFAHESFSFDLRNANDSRPWIEPIILIGLCLSF